MTILIAFHQSGYRCFKDFYTDYICQHCQSEFPALVSYPRFIAYLPSVLVPLFAYLLSLRGSCTGISFVDSTSLVVCDIHRAHQHKVFAGIAHKGKTSCGWFFGFKLHLTVNDKGELLSFRLTAGNVDDRKPVKDLLAALFGKVFADRGYISQELIDFLAKEGICFITKVRKNMKKPALSALDAALLRKRAIIETVIDQLKNISQVEHTRHRAPSGFLWNLAAALIAYCHQPKKPSLRIQHHALAVVP
jgi:hypothetical protein